MRKFVIISLLLSLGAVLAGCGTDYCWRSAVPDRMRTVAVPTFRNESEVTELGGTMTRQVLREFQREGTFIVKSAGEAALEVQGVVKEAGSALTAYDRRAISRMSARDFTARVEVSVIDKTTGRVLVDNRRYDAHTTLTANQDLATAMRDASGRLAEDLARQVVNDVINLNW